MLKLNADKTEFILLVISSVRHKLAYFLIIKTLGNDLSPAEVVNNLGVYLEFDLICFKPITFNQPSYLSSIMKSSELTRGK